MARGDKTAYMGKQKRQASEQSADHDRRAAGRGVSALPFAAQAVGIGTQCATYPGRNSQRKLNHTQAWRSPSSIVKQERLSMQIKVMQHATAIVIATAAGAAFSAPSTESPLVIARAPLESWRSAAASAPAIPPAPEPASPEPKKKELTQPAPNPGSVESRTPEEAAARAADPKDPSGALIIKPPEGADHPANRSLSPLPKAPAQ